MNIYKPKSAEGISLEDSNILNKPIVLLSFEINKFSMGDKEDIEGALLTVKGFKDRIRVSGQVLLKQLGEMQQLGFPIASKIIQVKGIKFRYYKFAELTPSEITTISDQTKLGV